MGMTTNFTCASGYTAGAGGAPKITCNYFNATAGIWSAVSGSCVGMTLLIYLKFNIKSYYERWIIPLLLAVCPTSMSSPYMATIPSTPTVGTVVSVSCVAGYAWNVSPYGGTESATCVAGSPASWSISGGAQCVGNIKFKTH